MAAASMTQPDLALLDLLVKEPAHWRGSTVHTLLGCRTRRPGDHDRTRSLLRVLILHAGTSTEGVAHHSCQALVRCRTLAHQAPPLGASVRAGDTAVDPRCMHESRGQTLPANPVSLSSGATLLCLKASKGGGLPRHLASKS
jgi:hypothetical protein